MDKTELLAKYQADEAREIRTVATLVCGIIVAICGTVLAFHHDSMIHPPMPAIVEAK